MVYVNLKAVLCTCILRCCGRVTREEMFNIGQRPDVEDILVVITDGFFDDTNATWHEAMITRASNISIIAVSFCFVSRCGLCFL